MFEFVENDTLPTLVGSVTDDQGTPIDITGYIITLHIGYNTPLVKTATILDQVTNKGAFAFTWLNTTSTPTPADPPDLRVGTWSIEIQVVNTDGVKTVQKTVAGVPLRFTIAAQIA